MSVESRISKSLFLSIPVFVAGLAIAGSASARDFGALPYGWLNMDISNKLINQGSPPSGERAPTKLSPVDASAGYRHIRTSTFSLISGVYGGWYLNTGTFASTLFGAGVGILPINGSTVISDRFVKNEQEAKSLPALKVPAHAEGLQGWLPHDNVFYDTNGGVAFSVGVGYAFTGLSGDYYVQGEWTTYVEKLEGTKVFVKISNVSMKDVDGMLGNEAAYAMMSRFVKNDRFFSYVFDLSDARARQAYEAMIHGSMLEAQELEQSNPELATHEATESGYTKGYQVKLFMGLPFLNRSRTYGSLYNFSDTVIHPNHTRSDAQYGLYWDETDGAVFAHHTGHAKSFYGIAYKDTADTGTPARPIDQGKYGKLLLSYEDDRGDAGTLRDDLSRIADQTGIRTQLDPTEPALAGNPGYLHLSVTVVISEAATSRLMAQAAIGQFRKIAESRVRVDSAELSDSLSAVAEMESALEAMNQANARHDDVAFVNAYASFGKAMLRNGDAFQAVLGAANGMPIDISLQAEGEKISKLTMSLSPNGVNVAPLF